MTATADHSALVPPYCPANCCLPDAIICWLREERRLRRDLQLAGGSPDCEVLASDLKSFERKIDQLLALAVAEERAA